MGWWEKIAVGIYIYIYIYIYIITCSYSGDITNTLDNKDGRQVNKKFRKFEV